MKSVRKFFGHLCGGSGSRADDAIGDSPVDPPKDNEERLSEPTLLPIKEEHGEHENKETVKEYFAQSSYESLNESPSSRKKQNVIKAAYSVHCIYDVTQWKPENLGAAATDKLFSEAVVLLEPFFKHSQDLATLLVNFARQYSRDKKPNFQKCYQVYVKNKHMDGSNDLDLYEGSNLMDINHDDLQDPTFKQLKEIANSSKKLLTFIENVAPQIDERIAEASKHDIKETGKEKRDNPTSPSSGLLSKFSAPGKYRRNLKQLKENRRTLDSVHSEVESILLTICKDHKEKPEVEDAPTLSQEVEKTGSQTLLSMVASKEPASSLEINLVADSNQPPSNIKTSEPDEEPKIDSRDQESFKEEEVSKNVIVEEPMVERFKSDERLEASPTMEAVEQNYDDQRESEEADRIVPLRPNSPPMSPVQRQTASPDSVDGSHLLDFGSYIVVDPTANDETILRRSRSLDSLCSVSSRRTLSRYGSYEFVTDFEIKIAEKAENEKQQTKGSDPPKKTTNKRPKREKRERRPEVHGSTSPIYKYTEVGYNPWGL